MTRLFGALTLIALAACLGYAIEGNALGIAIFAIFVVVFGITWLGSAAQGATHE